MMARVPKTIEAEEDSLPYRVVIDFLEGTLRKQDAIAFARGFIEHHFDAPKASGYFVAPYESGYIFEAQEGGHQRAYLPAILAALAEDPAASVCVQMARRVLEVKRSASGVYTAILLPEGLEPQNPDKVFPEPGPKLTPFQRSGMSFLIAGGAFFGIGLLTLMLATVAYLVVVSGLLQPPLAKIDYAHLPLSQWPSLQNVGSGKSANYVKAVRLDNGQWNSDTGTRHEQLPFAEPTAGQAPSLSSPADVNTLAPPLMSAPKPSNPAPGNPNPQPPATAPSQ